MAVHCYGEELADAWYFVSILLFQQESIAADCYVSMPGRKRTSKNHQHANGQID